jgi:transposase
MESTGLNGKPVVIVLKQHPFSLLVVTAPHLKMVEGRKTDGTDAEWLADLWRLRLLVPSFIPDRPTRELREVTRYRHALIQECSREAYRIPKVLAGVNRKRGAAVSDILRVSGGAILTVQVDGQTDPIALAGRLSADLRLVLRGLLAHRAFLDEQIADLGAAITGRRVPHTDAIARWDTLPGVGTQTATVIVTGLRPDMGRFPTAAPAAVVGRAVSGAEREWGQAAQGPDPQGQPDAADRARGSGACGGSHQGRLPGGVVPPQRRGAGPSRRRWRWPRPSSGLPIT